MPKEEPSLATDCGWTNIILDQRMPHPEICRLSARRRDLVADLECVAHPMAA